LDSEGPGGIEHHSRSVVKCRGEVVSSLYEGGLDRSRDELTAFFAEVREVSREQSIRQIIGYRSVPRRITAATLK
jgi:hypothetical protein